MHSSKDLKTLRVVNIGPKAFVGLLTQLDPGLKKLEIRKIKWRLCRVKGDWVFPRGLKTLSLSPLTVKAAKMLIHKVPPTLRRLKLVLIATPEEEELCEAFLMRHLPGVLVEIEGLRWA